MSLFIHSEKRYRRTVQTFKSVLKGNLKMDANGGHAGIIHLGTI